MNKFKRLNQEQMNEGKKRFKKLLEYSFVNQEEDLLLDEDKPEGEEEPEQSAPSAPPEGNEQTVPPEGYKQPDPNISSGNPDENQDSEASFNDIGDVDMNMKDNKSDDIEIDVTDLTNKQDDLNGKVDDISKKTQKMMDTMINVLSKLTDKVQSKIQNTNSEIDDLKKELIQRNPTPKEVLQKRITVSDPFSQTPESYWNNKQHISNYRLSDDDDENKEYTIKPSDIGSINNREIYKSFDADDDDEVGQAIASMFRM